MQRNLPSHILHELYIHHHTTQDDISHISNTSLEITGKTIEQFLYNNYIDDPNNTYQGNYPWTQDRNLLDVNIFIILIIIIALIGISIVILILRRNSSDYDVELPTRKKTDSIYFIIVPHW